MSPETLLPLFKDLANQFESRVRTADLDAKVESCPGWAVRDLVDHLGCVHRWAAQCARDGKQPAQFATREGDDDHLADWYHESARELETTLAGLDPTDETWTFDPNDRTTTFWRRRQIHETTIHLIDLETATGGTVDDVTIGVDHAHDGVNEWATVFAPRMVASTATPWQHRLTVICPDVNQTWQVGPTDGQPVTITAETVAMYRALWSRGDYEHVDCDGMEVGDLAGLPLAP